MPVSQFWVNQFGNANLILIQIKTISKSSSKFFIILVTKYEHKNKTKNKSNHLGSCLCYDLLGYCAN